MENTARSFRSDAHKGATIDASVFTEVTTLLQGAVQENVFPGAVLLVAKDGQVVFHKSVGLKSAKLSKDADPKPMGQDTVFDIGAVTQAVATTTLFMRLIEIGKVKLTDRVSIYLQGFSVHNKSGITIADLLTHSAGFPSSHPFFEELLQENTGSRLGILTSKGARDYIINVINRSSLKYPPHTRQVQSEIGFILLGQIVEILTGTTLDKALHKYVIAPLGLKSTSYIDLSLIRRRGIHPVTDLIAPTEHCPWRQRVIWGEVQDDNAWAMGGIAGHNGLFSTAYDLHILTRELLFAYRGGSTFLKRESVQNLFKGPPAIDESGESPLYRYGWESPNKENGMIDSEISASAVGSNGATGCSVWLEPEKGVEIILLTNRSHTSRSNKKINTFRPSLHTKILSAFEKHGSILQSAKS